MVKEGYSSKARALCAGFAVFLLALLIPIPACAGANEASAELQVSCEGDMREHRYIICALTNDAPMPENEEVVLKGNSEGVFRGFLFHGPGEYQYEVREAGAAGDIYTIQIYVAVGAAGDLTANVYAFKNNGTAKTDKLVFRYQMKNENETEDRQVRTGSGKTAAGTKTGDTAGTGTALFLLAGALLMMWGCSTARKGKETDE